MATHCFVRTDDAGADLYIRVWALTGADAGKVLDFNDNTFKTLGSATTPYLDATEYADMDGSAKSGYIAALDLSEVNSGEVLKQFRVSWYDNATPASTDVAVASEDVFYCRFSEFGNVPVEVVVDQAVTSSAGSECRFVVWLEVNGVQVDPTDFDATPAVSVVVREHSSGSNLFTVSGDETDLQNELFKLSQSSPGFTDDRLYVVTATITLGSTSFVSKEPLVVLG